ncbi:hypothetical protein BP6252_10268 [Coleophoma cylindrospora]|uniref:Uncharacterized protein n=1 Tax=Coleophoma cylindrospora TaxID=1849047 RepID=A0A3D8QS60_9HELO|nr:hypothetical protein BP6252_10268 [Coleophoma cylindrospora]
MRFAISTMIAMFVLATGIAGLALPQTNEMALTPRAEQIGDRGTDEPCFDEED